MVEMQGRTLKFTDGWPEKVQDAWDAWSNAIISQQAPSILYKKPTAVRIIYNDPATIVFWNDGTKTVVKKAKGERFNKYTAFCAALAKKIYGNNSRVNKIVKSGYDQKLNEQRR